MPSFRQANLRHVIHYLAVLHDAEKLYLEGGDALARGLALIDLEWANVQLCQKWTTGNAERDTAAAELCVVYPDAGANILFLRQHPRERIRYQEIALATAR